MRYGKERMVQALYQIIDSQSTFYSVFGKIDSAKQADSSSASLSLKTEISINFLLTLKIKQKIRRNPT